VAYDRVEQSELVVVRHQRSAACHRESWPVHWFKQVSSVVMWRPILL